MVSNGMPSSHAAKGHNLWVHDERFSRCELILNPDIFPMIRPGSLVEISPVSSWASSSSDCHPHFPCSFDTAACDALDNSSLPPDPRLVLQVAQADIASRQGQLQVSVASHIAQLFGLQARTDVYVRLVDPAQVSSDYVELTIRDQYLSRADMYRIKQAMTHQTVHVGKKIVFAGGLRAQVRDIVRKERKTAAGYVTVHTKPIFRSESARVYILLQISCEMWDFAEQDGGCDTYFDMATRDYLPELFMKWKQLNVNHLVTFIFFARVLYDEDPSVNNQDNRPSSSADTIILDSTNTPAMSSDRTSIHHYNSNMELFDPSLFKHNPTPNFPSKAASVPSASPYIPPTSTFSCSVDPWMIRGQTFRDLYKIVVDSETRSDWSTVLSLLKAEFNQFRSFALMSIESGIPVIKGRFAHAHQGNILEAVNLVLNPHDKNYQDRKLDFVRTGLSIQIITAGTGYLETDKCLQRLTTQRMLDNGVALDLICLCRPPLHITPVFLIASKFPYSEDHMADEPRMSRISFTKDRRAEAWDPLYFDDEQVDNPEHLYFTVPDWIDVSYVYHASYSCFNPRMRMPEITFNTLAAPRIDPQVPFLEEGEWENYDSNLFQDDVLPRSSSAFFRHGLRFGLDVAARTSGAAMNSSLSGLHPTLVEFDDLIPHSTAIGYVNSLSIVVPPHNGISNNTTSPITSIMMTTSVKEAIPRLNSEVSVNPKHVNYASSSADPSTLVNVPLRRPAGNTILSVSPSFAGHYMVRTHHSGRHRLTDDASAVRQIPETGHTRLRESYESGTGLALAELHHQSNTSTGQGAHIESVSVSGIPNSNYLGASPRRNFPFLTGPYLTRMSENIDHRASCGIPSMPSYPNATSGTTPPNSGNSYQNMQLRPNLINPWHPKRNVIKQLSHLQRWHHVYPQQSSHCIAGTMWNSLCTPASLPLTTQSFPTAEELLDLYQEYTYTVSPSESGTVAPELSTGKSGASPGGLCTSSERSGNAHALLTQMISLRLSQGFQIVLVSGHPQFQIGGGTDTYLSMGHHLHKLSVMGDQNVEVKRYVRKLHYTLQPMTYNMYIWSRESSSFVKRSTKFEYPQLATFNWNFVDHLISENEDEGDGDTFHLYRTRFVFIPMDHIPTTIIPAMANDHLDEEEMRIAGFQRLLETLQKHVLDGTPICVQLTSLTQSAHVRAEIAAMAAQKAQSQQQHQSLTTTASSSPSSIATSALGVVAGTLRRGSLTALLGGDTSPGIQNSAKSHTKLTKDSKSILIAHAMQNLTTGVKFSDRRWHLRLYERVFVGSEAVEWMIRFISDIESRDDAVALGNQLLQAGVFVHPLQKHGFMDGHFFYRLRPDLYLRPLEETSPSSLSVASLPATAASVTGSSVWYRSRHGTMDEVNLSHSSSAGAPSGNLTSTEAGAGSVSLTSTPLPAHSSSNTVADIKARLSAHSLFSIDATKDCMVELSRKVPINLDLTQKSDSKQVAMLHFDTVHNPRHVFSIQIHWLMCTTWRLVEVLSQWSRIGEKCGLRLVQVPVDQVKLIREHEDSNPFHNETVINLAVLPPADAIIKEHGAARLFYEVELIKQFGFVLDIESDEKFPAGSTYTSYDPGRLFKHSQYIHRSGSAFILLRPASEGLIWISNPLFLTTLSLTTPRGGGPTSSASLSDCVPLSPEQCCKSTMVNAEVLRISLMAYCQNVETLTLFWASVANQLQENPAPAALIEDLEGPLTKLETVSVPTAVNSGDPGVVGLGLLSAPSSSTASPMPPRSASMSCIQEDQMELNTQVSRLESDSSMTLSKVTRSPSIVSSPLKE